MRANEYALSMLGEFMTNTIEHNGENNTKENRDGSNTNSIYMRIYYQLIDDIMTGKYNVGDAIPTQNELAERFGVSRVTVREAIKELIRRNVLSATKGKGTFVMATPSAFGSFERTDGSSKTRYVNFGKKIKSKVIDISVVPADRQLAAELMIPEYTLLTRIRRIRLSGENPACLDDAYIVNRYVENIDFYNEDLETGSLYDLLRDKASIVFVYMEEKMRAMSCTAEVAQYLQIMPGEPVLNIRRRSFDQYGKVIEFCENNERSDMYYTVVQTRRTTHGNISSDNYNKLLGCLLGAAVGEALGGITRLLPRTRIVEEFGGHVDGLDAFGHVLDQGRQASVTDGFSLAYFTALELIKSEGNVTEEHVRTALCTWANYPEFVRYAGGNTKNAVRRLKGLEIIDNRPPATRQISYENDKASNTSAIKVFPAGLINPGNLDKAVRDAMTICIETHPFDVTISAAAAVAVAVAKAMEEGATLDDVLEAGLYGARQGKKLGEKYAKRLASPSVEKRMELAIKIGKRTIGWENAMEELGDIIGSGQSAVEAVPCAFGILAASSGNIMQGIKMGTNVGFDTDTVATIVGSIAGALYGVQTIPMKYLEAINSTNGFDLERLAHDFASTFYAGK